MFKERQESSVTTVRPDSAKHAGGFSRAVAVGVGPGGTGALTEFFRALRPGCDLAFIVVQHGSPSAPDELTQLIGSVTEMAVSRLQYGGQLIPNEIRVAPPGYAVELHAGRLQLELPPEPSERRTVVDRLFRSMSRSLGARTVGVVLPGTGSDGSLGARAIAREGGAVFAARDPATAAAGDSDTAHVLDPSQIGELLQQPDGLGAYAAALPKARAAATSQVARLSAEKLSLQEQNLQLQRVHAELERRLAQAEQKLATAQARDAAWKQTQVQQHRMLGTASIGMISLDAQLRVESFAGHLSDVYPLTRADLGQPLSARPHHARSMPALPALDSLKPGAVAEADVVTSERWYVRRAFARYDATGCVPVGMTLVFIDVTRIKRASSGVVPQSAASGGVGTGTPSSIVSYADDAASQTLPPRPPRH